MKKSIFQPIQILLLLSLIIFPIHNYTFAKAVDIEYSEIDENGKSGWQKDEEQRKLEEQRRIEEEKRLAEEAKKKQEEEEAKQAEKNKKQEQKLKDLEASKRVAKLVIATDSSINIYNKDGNLVTSSWFTLGKNRYYLNASGKALIGWQKLSNQWYYFNHKGEVQQGWINQNGKIYYLNPETKGAMQLTPIVIGNEIFNFNEDGSFASKNPTLDSIQQNGNKAGIQSLIKWVKSDTKRNEIEVSKEIIDELNVLLEKVPQHLIDKLVDKNVTIYICMEQDNENRTYMQKMNYKDKQSGDTEEEEIPFKSSETAIFIKGDNLYNIYLGLGSWSAENYQLQGRPVYQHSTWATIQNNKKEELDDLMGLSNEDLTFYRASAKISMSSAIAWMMYNQAEFAVAGEKNNKAYSFVNSFFKIDTDKGPGV